MGALAPIFVFPAKVIHRKRQWPVKKEISQLYANFNG